MKMVLDPSLIWFGSNHKENFEYLDKVVEFIETYIDLKYLASSNFLSRLICLLRDPMNGYSASEEQKNVIISRIWKSLDNANVVDLSRYSTATMPDSYEPPERQDLQDYITEIFGYAENEKVELLMFLALKNHKCKSNTHGSIVFAKHIYKELGSYLAEMFSNGEHIKRDNIVKPSYHNPLPNSDLCKEYSTIRIELIAAGMGDISNYKRIGHEVALRNGYVFNPYLTKINNEAIREIFTWQPRPTIHISTDIEHGAFEAFTEKGNHLGEFSYEGKMTQGPSKDHTIKLKR
jgi:hypothetical protein